ncbi:hypothetical protein DMB90_09800 [Raoultella planticola]|uniref:Uncharacterized protein n=1 Tax=Raoultella planticola TaxID=575 RepID=A0A5P6A9P4_RAOPL|nr:hypothetical protein DMB90_09800 [Raoultella planticola]
MRCDTADGCVTPMLRSSSLIHPSRPLAHINGSRYFMDKRVSGRFVWFADPEWSIMPAENAKYVIN